MVRVSKKDLVSGQFLNRITAGMPDPDQGPKVQLDFLLPIYRALQSEKLTVEAKMAFMEPIIIDALSAIEQTGSDPEYVTKTRRTMAMLVRSPQTLGSGREARNKAERIRRLVGKYLGSATGKSVVSVRRTVSYQVNWQLVAAGGQGLVKRVQAITGLKPKPALSVGRVFNRAKLGKRRKGR